MKTDIGKVNALYPMPTVIVGTETDEGKPNYIAIAHVGIMGLDVISICSGKKHFSNIWIKKNMTLSVNIPSEDMLEKTDLVGSVSGHDTDKSEVFTAVRGELPAAPLIEEAPVSMECRVIDIYDRKTHDVFICQVVNTYAKDEVLTDGRIDFSKVRPIYYDMPTFSYWGIGPRIGKAHRLREKILAFMKKQH